MPDPNLGNCPFAFSLPFPNLVKSAIFHAISIAYFSLRVAISTLRFPAVSLLLLPPCFPGHAAPAWGSKYKARGPPERRSNFERNDNSIHGQIA